MKTNELRVGNFVRIAINKHEYKDFQVTLKDISKARLYNEAQINKGWQMVCCKSCKRIYNFIFCSPTAKPILCLHTKGT